MPVDELEYPSTMPVPVSDHDGHTGTCHRVGPTVTRLATATVTATRRAYCQTPESESSDSDSLLTGTGAAKQLQLWLRLIQLNFWTWLKLTQSLPGRGRAASQVKSTALLPIY